jgi:hypothetical protein
MASDVPVPTRVMIHCETGGKDVFTGHRMRPAELNGMKEPRAFRCVCCGAVHSWTSEAAWCEERPRYG